jgi:hypothetical protein
VSGTVSGERPFRRCLSLGEGPLDPAQLERHILDWEAQPDDDLLCRRDLRPNRLKAGEKFITEYRDHRWASVSSSPSVDESVPACPSSRTI